jgi:hypothetical protein
MAAFGIKNALPSGSFARDNVSFQCINRLGRPHGPQAARAWHSFVN